MHWGNVTSSQNNRYNSHSTWGAQRAGLAIVSDFLLKPMAEDGGPLYTYQSILGTLIDIPTEDGYIVGYDAKPKAIGEGQYCLLANKSAIMTALSSPPSSALNVLRLDLEPCWEDDPDKCSFVLRAGGLPKSQLPIDKLCYADKQSLNGAHCASANPFGTISCDGSPGPSCPGPETILRYLLTLHERWFELPLLRLIETAKLGNVLSSPAAPPEKPSERWIVRTHDNEFLLRLAIMVRLPDNQRTKGQKILTNCLGAALASLPINTPCAVMIILHQEAHNRLLEPHLRPDYDTRTDLLQTAAHHLWIDDNRWIVPDFPILWKVSRFIWLPADYGDNHRYPDLIAAKLAFYRYNGGMTEAGMLSVMQEVNLDRIINHQLDVAANAAVIEERTEAAIKAWQAANMSRRDIQYMLLSIHAVDDEVDRSDDPLIAGRTPQYGVRPDGGRYEDLPPSDYEDDSVYESGSEGETGEV